MPPRNAFIETAERILPLLIGLAVGMLFVATLARVPPKWAVFIVGAAFVLSTMTLVGTLSRHLRGGLLFLAVLSLPTFYENTFLYRENVRFSVLANGFPISLFDVIVFPLLIGWLYELWSNREHARIRFPRLWLTLMLLLLAINLINALFVASDPFFSYSMIYMQVKCYLTMFFLANYLRDEHSFRIMGYAFAGVLIIEGLIVLEQRFVGAIFTPENLGRLTSLKSKVGATTVVRLAGTLNHPNDLAMYLNLAIPWTGFMLTIEKKPLRKLYLIAALGLALVALIWSGSRGGWLGLAVAIAAGVFFWSRKHGRSPLIGMAIMLFSLTALFGALFAGSDTFRNRLVEGDAGSAEVRYPLMDVAMEMISQNPALGVGLNLYTREMVPYDRTNHFIAYRYNHPVHNTFLMVGAETGLPSLLLLATLVFLMIKETYRITMENEGIVSVAGIGLMGTLVSWFIHNQVNLTAPYNDPTLWVLLGVLAAARNFTDRKQESARAVPLAAPATGRA